MQRIQRMIRELSERQWLESTEINDWGMTSTTYHMPGEYDEETSLPEGTALTQFPGQHGITYFFRKELDWPETWGKEGIGLVFNAGSGEGLLRVNGTSYQGLDRNHTYVTLDPAYAGKNSKLELTIELYDPIPEPIDPLNHQANRPAPISSITSLLVKVNRPVQSLMYTLRTLLGTAQQLAESDMRRVRLREAMYRTLDGYLGMSEADIREGSRIRELEEQLIALVKQIGGSAEGIEHMVGQSHIDIAWLWPVRETVRKTSRTFSTVDRLMDEYPEYQFAQSQPILYQFLKEHDPELYERVKRRIQEGRWELVGGMWVEPDLNIPSGESLMRQMLYGQRFYEQEFGRTSEIEWLPDTFGYCASLPQILQHGGIRYFMTTKLNWNDTNVFPFDLFQWVGIDGTPMLSYLNHGLNEDTSPKDIEEHWQSYRQRAVHPQQMLLYGHGDGGGGVTREMLEYMDRSELLVGQPEVRYSTAAAFFQTTEEARHRLPKWHGDLYLELHRGTYTTHARNKRANRKAEVLYREAEVWHSLSKLAGGDHNNGHIESVNLEQGWKLILLNQFHDIIPGSAITETYDTSSEEYKQIFNIGSEVLAERLRQIAEHVSLDGAGIPYIVCNSLGWARNAIVDLDVHGANMIPYDETGQVLQYERNEQPDDEQEEQDDQPDSEQEQDKQQKEQGQPASRLHVLVKDIPAFGYRTIWLKEQGIATGDDLAQEQATSQPAEFPDQWETAYYSVTFGANGEITSLWDKDAAREIVRPGEQLNRLELYHDRPTYWDAWDIDPRYEQQKADDPILVHRQLLSHGKVQDIFRFTWKLSQSTIRQDVIFYHHDKRIDFKTHVEWNEAHKLLKAAFPVQVVTNKAVFEIPFGTIERSVHRNTSWEQAQFEVCGHRFVDLSEHGYGVSLLNDCKYGYDIQESTIRLSLLRAPKWPDLTADLGEHSFTYSLYPHLGSWQEAGTLRKAAELNTDIQLSKARSNASSGTLPERYSLLPFQSQHVILDTLKPAEDGTGWIVRMYEASGGNGQARLTWPAKLSEVFESDALEKERSMLSHQEGVIDLSFRPYEIKTIKMK
ncbi:alpha-mannosidase [Paenibacillus shunpengii]|uniref:Alpha-mannosidase n=1 Tax=Paenibacillus shunpengii TaxID=2054424 RepID=A0ABW5SK93_9BACL